MYLMCMLATPSKIFELVEAVISSRNSTVWADIFAALLFKWTSVKVLEDEELPAGRIPVRGSTHRCCTHGLRGLYIKTNPQDFTTGSPSKLLTIFRKHPTVVPSSGNCFAVFFLYKRANFVDCWNNWLLPGLRHRGYQVTTAEFLCITLLNHITIGGTEVEPRNALSAADGIYQRSSIRSEDVTRRAPVHY